MADLVAYPYDERSLHLARRQSNAARRLSDLEAQFRLAQDARERAILADALVPQYISRGDARAAAEALASVQDGDEAEIRARLLALRGVVAAMRGEDAARYLEGALELLPSISEPSVVTIHQRAGVAYFFARQPHEAEEHCLQALWLSDFNGLRWEATAAASVLYGIHYHLTGDLKAARYYAEVQGVEAVAAGNKAARRSALNLQYDLAATFAEWERAATLRALLRREGSIDSYGNEFPARVADCLVQGHQGNFPAMRGLIEVLAKQGSSTADFALAHALGALALAGLGLDEEARRESRRALGLSREPALGAEFAHLTIRRRLGAVLAAHACVLIGDIVRGSRALDVRTKLPGAIGALAQALCHNAVRGASIDVDDPALASIKGYAVVTIRAAEARASRARREVESVRVLTDTELILLRSAASGKTNGEIARERGVTRNAVERRLMSAYEKLGVRTRAEAIAKLTIQKI